MPKTTSNASITAAARQAIEVLLRFKGFDVTLLPKNGAVVAKPSGGRDFVPSAPRQPQKIALSKLGGDNVGGASTDDGQFITRNYVLTGRWNMDIAIGDSWSDDEADYTVDTLDQTNGFKTSADVIGFLKIADNLGDVPLDPPKDLDWDYGDLLPPAPVEMPTPAPNQLPKPLPGQPGWTCCGAGVLVDGEWQCCGNPKGVTSG